MQIKGKKYYAVFRVNGKPKWHNLNIETKRGNKRKAEQAMSELVAQYSDNPNMFDKIDFVEYIKKWLKGVIKHIDQVTYEGYSQYTKKHIIPYFSEKSLKLQDVKIADIEGYYNYKSVGGRLDGKSGGLSKRSIKLHGVVLSLVFKQAMHDGLLKNNPCEYAKIPNNAISTKKHINFYTVEQCKKLLEVIKGTPLYNIVVITFMYGLRRSEIMGLKWDAINFDDNTVTIQHTRVLNASVVVKDKTKNNSSNRTYPMLNDVRIVLENIKKQQGEYSKLFGNCYINSGYVFTLENGKEYHPSYPTHRLEKFLKQYNLPHIRFHDLRHSCASILLDKGWNMKAISEWLGHSSIAITANIYAHINLEQKREMAQGLNGMFDN